MQIVICKKRYEGLKNDMLDYFSKIPDEGSFFAIYTTEYDGAGNVVHDFFDVISEAVRIGYKYVNTIVYPTTDVRHVFLEDNVKYVVWLCKDNKAMKFNKDHIREKHIWKDVEWGKRAKNYNPKGKDPGNVWIPTIDDGHANITEHILLSDADVIQRIIGMTECNDDYALLEETAAAASCVRPQERNICNEAGDEPLAGKVIFDTAEDMAVMEDGSVSVFVTSPPYWNLKDYFKKGQIGQESYDQYLTRMEKVWAQCYNKLKGDGTLWININIRQQNGEVILIPHDIIKSCKKIGFKYKGILIWHKSSGIPTGDKNIVDRHEYVLLFSKEEKVALNFAEYSKIQDYKNSAINSGAFWNINRKAGSVGKKYIHPAIYPNELVERIVRVGSVPGEIVADPFLGSGTSLIAAINAGRQFVGYEYNEGFKELMESRFQEELVQGSTYLFA